MNNIKAFYVFSALLGGAGASFTANAQIEEVVVTSERRSESLQNVPKSVTAVSAEMMEVKQIGNVTDIQYQIPNLNIGTSTGTANAARVFLRGIGEDESRGADMAVGIYVDDVYIGRSVGALLDLVDLERVEVLRGPQGTLYGRNSNGGAIRLISKKPSTEASDLELATTFGNNGRIDGSVGGNLAISSNTALRASLLSRQRDGFFEIKPNGDFEGQDVEVGEKDTLAARLSLLHMFSDDWSLNIAIDKTEDRSDPGPDTAAPPNDVDNDLFTIEPLPGVTCNAETPTSFLPLGCFTGHENEIETQGASVTFEGDISGYSFKSLSAYREMNDEMFTRIGFVFSQETDQDQLSQEFTLSSNYDGPFNFVSGLYYFEEDWQLDSTFIMDFSFSLQTESIAAFFQSTAELTEALTLTTGVRYTDEERKVEGVNLTLESGTGAYAAERVLDNTKATYNIALDYRFSEELMAYTSYATGFKSGGASPDCFSATSCFLPVENEDVKTWELGLRSEFFDSKLRANLTYFYSIYEGLQIAATVPDVGFTRFNVDETEISGIEGELTLQPTENLSFNLMFGLLDAEYTQLTEAQASALTNSGGSCPNGIASVACAKDLELKNAPEFKTTLGVVYQQPIRSGSITASADVSYEDDSWSLVANAPEHALSEVGTIVNARVAYTSADEAWKLALWGKNLTDEEYWRAAVSGSSAVYASEPLTYGVDLSYRFQ